MQDPEIKYVNINNQEISLAKAKMLHPTGAYSGYYTQTQAYFHVNCGKRPKQQDATSSGLLPGIELLSQKQQEKIIRAAVAEMEKLMDKNWMTSGSTAIIAIVMGNKIITVALGDSTLHVAAKNTQNEIETCYRLNKTLHHPSKPLKLLNIFSLNIDHAFADYSFEPHGLKHDPDIYFDTIVCKSTGIIASDGLTEAARKMRISDSQYIQNILFAKPEMRALPTSALPQNLAFMAIERIENGSNDNIANIVFEIDPNNTNSRYFAVFDGHGNQGELVSQRLADKFLGVLQNQVQLILANSDTSKQHKQMQHKNQLNADFNDATKQPSTNVKKIINRKDCNRFFKDYTVPLVLGTLAAVVLVNTFINGTTPKP